MELDKTGTFVEVVDVSLGTSSAREFAGVRLQALGGLCQVFHFSKRVQVSGAVADHLASEFDMF